MILKKLSSEQYLEYTMKAGMKRQGDNAKGQLLNASDNAVTAKQAFNLDGKGRLARTFKGTYKVVYEIEGTHSRFSVTGKTDAEIRTAAAAYISSIEPPTQPAKVNKGPATIEI
jgi:carbon monoxide dehydrogenase subunit G